MTTFILTTVEKNGISTNNTRLQPLITWLQLLNIITISLMCLLFLKIYKGMLLLYEWLFPFKHVIECPTILVIGPQNDMIREIVFQLSKRFNAEIINFYDINKNSSLLSMSKSKLKSRLIYSHVPISSQKVIAELSKYVQKTFGFIDVLIMAQNEDSAGSNSTHSFLNHLNKQLLAQFWTVMAFLPEMLRRDSGYIISVALGRSSLTNTGIMRTIHEELLQCDTKVKMTLVESNTVLDEYLPSLSTDILARLIVRSMWNSDTVVRVPSLPSYFLMLPVLMMRFLMRPICKIVSFISIRNS